MHDNCINLYLNGCLKKRDKIKERHVLDEEGELNHAILTLASVDMVDYGFTRLGYSYTPPPPASVRGTVEHPMRRDQN